MEIDAKDLKPGMVVVFKDNPAKLSNLPSCADHNVPNYCRICRRLYIGYYRSDVEFCQAEKIRILHSSPSPKCPYPGCQKEGFCSEHQYYCEERLS